MIKPFERIADFIKLSNKIIERQEMTLDDYIYFFENIKDYYVLSENSGISLRDLEPKGALKKYKSMFEDYFSVGTNIENFTKPKKSLLYTLFFTMIFIKSTPIHEIMIYQKRSKLIENVLSERLLNLSKFLFSQKTVNEVLKPLTSDWQEEYFEALSKKEIWKARWINVRYTYAFLAAMWMKSPIGDLIEFIRKFAK